jgi:hypothetical protein
MKDFFVFKILAGKKQVKPETYLDCAANCLAA